MHHHIFCDPSIHNTLITLYHAKVIIGRSKHAYTFTGHTARSESHFTQLQPGVTCLPATDKGN